MELLLRDTGEAQKTIMYAKKQIKEIFLKNLSESDKKLFEKCDADEWSQLAKRAAVKVHGPSEAEEIRKLYGDRSIGSIMLRKIKFPIDAPKKAKSRWCV